MTVSVVIPTRNRWNWLVESLGSVLAQRDVELEVIVVDDASTDPRPASLQGMDARVRWLRHEQNVGVAAARNAAARLAGGDWIAFLDDDDIWAPDHLSTLVDACQCSDARFGYSASWIIDGERNVKSHRPAPDPASLRRTMLETNAIGSPSGVMVARDLWLESGGFDETLSPMADWDLWLRISRSSRGATNGLPTLGYTEHGGNMSLGMPLVLKEFHLLEHRYEDELRTFGVRLGGDAFPAWIAGNYRRSGRRREATRWYLRSAMVSRRPRDLLRGVGVNFGETFMERFAKPRSTEHSKTVPWLETISNANTNAGNRTAQSL